MNAPKLRFKEFDGEWENPTLDKLVERVTRKNKNLESELPLTISADKGLVDQITYFNKNVSGKDLSGYYLLKKGEFAYNKSYSNGYPWGAIKQLENYNQGLLSTLYICFKAINVDDVFLKHYFETTHWHKEVSMIAAEGARNHGLLNIPVNEFFKIKLSVPNNNEQKKIGDLFEKLNKKIQLQQEKIDLLKEQKKGYIQKIFSQELRFKDRNGQKYPSWERLKLKEFLVPYAEKTTCNNQYPPLTSSRDGIFLQSEYFKRQVASEDNTGYNIVPYGYFTYRHMSDDATFKFNINDIVENGIVSTLYPVFTTNGKIDMYFLKFFLNESPAFKRYGLLQKQGGSRTYMYFSKLIEFESEFPSIEEQLRIKEFLKVLDKKIQNENLKHELLVKQKQAFMQQMFI